MLMYNLFTQINYLKYQVLLCWESVEMQEY